MVQCATQLGRALILGGWAAEAEVHFRECLEKQRPSGSHHKMLTNEFILMFTAFRAEAVLMQGRKDEALPLWRG